MSTEIKSINARPGEERSLLIEAGRRYVNVMAERGFGRTVPRAAFLAAVETELGVHIVAADAIVIERADVPPVTDGSATDPDDNEFPATVYDTPEGLRAWGCTYLALAEYLAAHQPVPPVSDEDVETVVQAIIHRLPGSDPVAMVPADQTRAVIRAALATGKVTVRP